MGKSSMTVEKALAIIPFGIFLLFVDNGEEWLMGLIAIAVGVMGIYLSVKGEK